MNQFYNIYYFIKKLKKRKRQNNAFHTFIKNKILYKQFKKKKIHHRNNNFFIVDGHLYILSTNLLFKFFLVLKVGSKKTICDLYVKITCDFADHMRFLPNVNFQPYKKKFAKGKYIHIYIYSEAFK